MIDSSFSGSWLLFDRDDSTFEWVMVVVFAIIGIFLLSAIGKYIFFSPAPLPVKIYCNPVSWISLKPGEVKTLKYIDDSCAFAPTPGSWTTNDKSIDNVNLNVTEYDLPDDYPHE